MFIRWVHKFEHVFAAFAYLNAEKFQSLSSNEKDFKSVFCFEYCSYAAFTQTKKKNNSMSIVF